MINRRWFLKSCGMYGSVLLSSLPGFTASNISQTTRRKPNIIIILADDLGYGDLSCYGNEEIHTPHLDALAEAGITFTDFHSSGAVCSPTRAGLMTGLYQQRVNVGEVLTVARHRERGLDTKYITFPKILQNHGYKTAIYGKWHLGYKPEFNPVHHGFDDFRGYLSGNVDYISHVDQAGVYDWWHNLESQPEEGYTTHLITSHALNFIEENQEHPF